MFLPGCAEIWMRRCWGHHVALLYCCYSSAASLVWWCCWPCSWKQLLDQRQQQSDQVPPADCCGVSRSHQPAVVPPSVQAGCFYSVNEALLTSPGGRWDQWTTPSGHPACPHVHFQVPLIEPTWGRGSRGGHWPLACNMNILDCMTMIWRWQQLLASGDITASFLNKLWCHLHQTNRTESTGSEGQREVQSYSTIG